IFSAARASTAGIRLDFARLPAAATLVVRAPAKPTAPARRVEMAVQEQHASADLELAADIEYTVEARDDAGVPAVPNRHRVRVTPAQPPPVRFGEPAARPDAPTPAGGHNRAPARAHVGPSGGAPARPA